MNRTRMPQELNATAHDTAADLPCKHVPADIAAREPEAAAAGPACGDTVGSNRPGPATSGLAIAHESAGAAEQP